MLIRCAGASRKTIVVLLVGLMLGLLTATVAQGLPVCPTDGPICRAELAWTETALLQRISPLVAHQGSFLVTDDQLTIIYRRAASDTGQLALIVLDQRVPMDRVEDSAYWTVTLQFEDVERALLTLGLEDDGAVTYPVATFRGAEAPSRPPQNDLLVGRIERLQFESTALEQNRAVNVYLPPDHDPANTYPTIYMTDGDNPSAFVAGVDYLITEGIIPPVIVVGVAAAQSQDGRNVRGEEYVVGRNPDLFDRHTQFFTQEVREWAEANVGASTEREQRGIFGVSNGGLFAVTMNALHPELYGFVFTFSAGASAGYADVFTIDAETVQLPLYVYGTSGTLEPLYFETTTEFIAAYADAGATVHFSSNVAGHDSFMWLVEFINAVRWRFEPAADATD